MDKISASRLLRSVAPAALAVGLVASVLTGQPVQAASADPLNIGFIGSFSGVGASRAQDALDGFKLGIKHLGGRLGSVEFDLTVLDDKHSPDAAKRAAERLMHDARTQVILVASSPKVAALVAPTGAAGHSFVISLSPPTPALAGKDCSPYFFSLSGLSDTLHEQAGLYLQNQDYRNLAVLRGDTPEERAAADAFRRGFKGTIQEIISQRGAMSFARDIRQVRQSGPDAIYLLHTGGMAVNFIRQWEEAKLKGVIPLFGPGGTFDQPYISATGMAGVDLFSISSWSEDLDSPSNRRMMSDFEGEYGRPASSWAARGYDAAMLLDGAIRLVDRKYNDDDALRTGLRNADFPSTRGSWRFDQNHFPIQTYLLRGVVEVEANVRGHYANETRGVVAHDVRDGRAGECQMRWAPMPPPPVVQVVKPNG